MAGAADVDDGVDDAAVELVAAGAAAGVLAAAGVDSLV